MMDEDDEIGSSARSSSHCQTSIEQADEDNIQTDCSTKESTTNDLGDNDRTNDGPCVPRNAADNIDEEKERTKKDKERETSVSSSHEEGDSIARGPLAGSHEQEKGDDERGRRTMNNKKEFLWKIHELLEELSKEQKEHIVSWSPNGTSFKVHNPEAFVQEIMPRYSTATQFRSFEKMLNLYDFKKLKGGPQRGGYQHPMFRRDNRELCQKIKMRPKPKRRNKGSRGSLGGRKSHVEHGVIGGLDEHLSEQRGPSLEDLDDLEDNDQNLSSIDDISMGYFQQITATTNPTTIGDVPPNLLNHDESLVQSLEKQAHVEGQASRLYQNVLDMRKSPQLSSILGGTMTTGERIMLMNDIACSSSAATHQQQFTMFDHSIIPTPPSSTATSSTRVVPLHHDPHSATRFDHAAPPAAAVPGSFLQPPTSMVRFGVGGIIPSFPGLLSGFSAVDPTHCSTAFGSATTMMTTRSTPPSAIPELSESRINPLSLEPPIYNHFLDLGAGPPGTSSANMFVDHVTSIHHAQRARHQPTEQLRPQEQLYSSSTTMARNNIMSPSSLSLPSFDPTVIAKHHHQEKGDQSYEDHDRHHSQEVGRMTFEEPLSDDLEPNPLP